jgi:hypothetical protein
MMGEGERLSYHASIDKSIFEIAVSGQELLAEEGGILDGVVEGDVEGKGWREVGEVDRLQHFVCDSGVFTLVRLLVERQDASDIGWLCKS